mmetsp:Transcript_14125/g.36035  ORF Transcript_14125/g.36035 Transcript_14125/m.36035 type:complete len:209 (+) Transcript_14125:377-1003(+)
MSKWQSAHVIFSSFFADQPTISQGSFGASFGVHFSLKTMPLHVFLVEIVLWTAAIRVPWVASELQPHTRPVFSQTPPSLRIRRMGPWYAFLSQKAEAEPLSSLPSSFSFSLHLAIALRIAALLLSPSRRAQIAPALWISANRSPFRSMAAPECLILRLLLVYRHHRLMVLHLTHFQQQLLLRALDCSSSGAHLQQQSQQIALDYPSSG